MGVFGEGVQNEREITSDRLDAFFVIFVRFVVG